MAARDPHRVGAIQVEVPRRTILSNSEAMRNEYG